MPPSPNPTSVSLAPFFALTGLLSAPFYILNALAYLEIVGGPEAGALYIALFTVTPVASASILTFSRRGSRGVKDLLGRVFDFQRIRKRRWYVAILLLSPLMFLLSLIALVLSGAPIPPPLTPLAALPAVLPFFFLLAAGEELGWMGYAFGRMQLRAGALGAALRLGMIWALWHVPFFVFMMPDPLVLAAQTLTLVATRVLVAWIFNNTGMSVFAAILFHAVDNTALVMFPEIKAVTPKGPVIICVLVVVAAFVVTLLWRPRSLARYEPGSSKKGERNAEIRDRT